MSTIQGKSQGSKAAPGNKIVKSTIQRAEAIQQREQLRQMVLNKFIQDLAKTSKRREKVIVDIVDEFFKTQKVTEVTLKELKVQVYQAVAQRGGSSVDNKSDAGSRRSQVPSVQGSQRSQPRQQQQQVRDDVSDRGSVRSQKSKQSQQRSQRGDDEYSETSSRAPQSVYYVEGDEEDGWATLVKFDTELFKKEQELEKMRQQEFKKKMKNELDKQLVEKYRKKDEDQVEENAFVDLQVKQLSVHDRREQAKDDEKKRKIMLEKRQRDKQVSEENYRKKQEKKREKELDEMLVQRLLQEKDMEEKQQLSKKEREKSRLLQMMKENEEYREKADKEAQEEKDSDIRLQQEYTRLLIEMEEQRDLEKKNREDKIKRIMSAFADSVVKDQKQIIREEDSKMMKHIMEQNDREIKDEETRKLQIQQQKKEMREFLNNQMDDKSKVKVQEQEVNRMQADIWAKDRQNYTEHEQQKSEYIRMVNKKHQEILREQMSEQNNKKKKGKMTVEELLQNKSKLKNIADQDPEVGKNLKKTTVDPKRPAQQ